ncbi:uncharacterized protein LOC126284135 isoform X1 [Schistocerca gregaria]|uniref:uncharacterized protein LOC126284135 isoform X1 n=1 Tax=Schistocerca gregaria TaxID=7010 RepID=UPI00211EF5E5|nr:uncharacterized protein LOC126284135 isoform X1 [Schistocerca gregaria]
MPENHKFVCLDDYEKHASTVLPRNALDYYASGAGREHTLKLNRNAFKVLRIRPRMMRNVSKRDMSTTVLGNCVSVPFGIAPTAMQRMAHQDGECATARAAGMMGTIFTLSTLSTSSIEEVAEAAPSTIKWFQLYIYKDRAVTEDLVRRAEKAGFKALVLTVDAPMFGIRDADIRNKFSLPPHLMLANFKGVFADSVQSSGGSGINEYVKNMFDASLTWNDVKWLKSITSLPIVVKGILTAEDAVMAVDSGVDAIQVSNHGARQLDCTPAPLQICTLGAPVHRCMVAHGTLWLCTFRASCSSLDSHVDDQNEIEVLPEIVHAINDRCEIYLDGGVREGIDVFKALALGAKMVFIGRPAIWGLAASGQGGVKEVLDILKCEFDHAMALSGCAKLGDIQRDMVVPDTQYCKL